MSTDKAETMQIITREEVNAAKGTRSFTDRVGLVTNTIDIDKLKQSFTKFVSGLQSIIDAEVDGASPFQLKEIHFGAEITASGDFKLLGSGIGVQGTSMITFVLHRKEPETKSSEG
jgi:hypothetical protein